MTEQQMLEMQAYAWRKLVGHFQKRTDVQNIDLMTQAGFCRNCMSKWLAGGAQSIGVAMDDEQAREHIYGMPYAEWKARYQKPASAEQMAAFRHLSKDDITE